MKEFRYLPGVTTLELNPEACVGCGTCELVCPHGVWQVSDKKARIVDRDGCMECGACALNCPAESITVEPGVGCAAYIIQSWIKGKENASCC
ncbi:MAG: 4Fe-4S binding protein [Deltaproteobacteria bacterium]|nr:4Fe-4S binding protein [Deltaproteobacteria bacterium]